MALGLRPLTARSVIASTLLGTRPPVLPTRLLVAAAGLFGVSDSAARSALSRMVASGEVEPDGDAAYRLAGSLVDRQQRQESSRRAELRPWSGDWWLVIIPAGRRPAAERARQRSVLARARLAELREGVWLRPDNLDLGPLDPDLPVGRFRPERAEPTAAQLWDLDGWATTATGLRYRMEQLTSGLRAGQVELLAPGFVVSAAVLRLFQRDPLLPADLLPATWPGGELRADYDRFDDAYRSLLRSWFRQQRDTDDG